MLTLAKGAVLARVIGLVSIPVLTRLYSPEDFGVLALYTALVAILAPTLTLRYVQAIPLPKTDAMAINLFAVCLKLIMVGATIITLALLVFGSTIFAWFDIEVLLPWWPLIVLGAAGTALYELFSLWATRKKQYKVLAKTQITQSLAGNIAKIGLGFLALKPAGLLVGQLINQAGGIGSFIQQSWQDFKQLKPKLNKKRSDFIAKYYRGFPLYRLPSQFLMIASQQAPILIVAVLYTKEVTGQLSLAIMALSLPVSLISQAVGKAYYAEIAAIGRRDLRKVQRITVSIQKKLFMVGIPLVLLMLASSEMVFSIVFGEEWRLAGQFSAILAPYFLFSFTSTPLIQVLNLLKSQLVYLFINLIRAIGLFFLFLMSRYLGVESEQFIVFYNVFMVFFLFSVTVFIFLSLNKLVNMREGCVD